MLTRPMTLFMVAISVGSVDARIRLMSTSSTGASYRLMKTEANEVKSKESPAATRRSRPRR